jgi:hypothetical protein
MDIVEFLMKHRRWAKSCLRTNIAAPDQMAYRGKLKVVLMESEVVGQRDRLLKQAIQDIAPEWWDDETQITINRNVTCQKHRDGNNGHSYLLWLGDFTGGALLFEDGTRIEEKYKWHKFDGQNAHWNEPHEGTKYGIVLYKGSGKIKKTAVILNKRKEAAEKALNLNHTENI